MTIPPAIALPIVLGAIGVAVVFWLRAREARRAEFIRTFVLPKGLYAKLAERRPELAAKDHALVARALRAFFLVNLAAKGKFVSMPSQVVDELWHEFILFTRDYERFCRQAFGRFLHHTPAVAMSSADASSGGLRRTFWLACREENINPAKPTRLPLLFAIDAKLKIANGFTYALDCTVLRATGSAVESTQPVYCASDFTSSGCGGATGCGGSSASDGGSCGGGGCGGGGD